MSTILAMFSSQKAVFASRILYLHNCQIKIGQNFLRIQAKIVSYVYTPMGAYPGHYGM